VSSIMSADNFTSDTRRNPRELTGRTVLICLVLFFALVAGVNAVMIKAAVTTFGGVESENSYQAGLAFAQQIAAAHAQDALRWRVEAKLSPSERTTVIELTVTDDGGWPPAGLQLQTFYPQPDHSLNPAPPAAGTHILKYVPSAGTNAGGPDIWWGELTTDQKPDDAFSLVYDSDPLSEETAILGFPSVLLEASATAPLADWFVRLSDVAPDGTVIMLTGGGLNGAQRDSESQPTDLEPGRVYPLKIDMHFTSWVFPRGHRIRLAVSNALWPMIWPTPYTMTTSLQLGGQQPSRLVLPVVPVKSQLPPPNFVPPEPPSQLPGVHSSGDWLPGELWTKLRDELHQATTWEWHGGAEVTEFPWGSTKHQDKLRFEVQDAHPENASFHGEGETEVNLPGRKLLWTDTLDFRSDKANFYYQFRRQLLKNGQVVREKNWQETIPRDHQ